MIQTKCCVCGVNINLDDEHYYQLLKCHNDFYCINGHAQHFTGETQKEKIIRRLKKDVVYYQEQMVMYRDWYRTVLRSRAYYRGMVTRLKHAKKP